MTTIHHIAIIDDDNTQAEDTKTEIELQYEQMKFNHPKFQHTYSTVCVKWTQINGLKKLSPTYQLYLSET